MSDSPETFEAFLSKWKNERLLPRGHKEIELDKRNYAISERANELETMCRERGTYTELVNTARSFGSIDNFIRDLIKLSDAQGTILRPTAHDGADD